MSSDPKKSRSSLSGAVTRIRNRYLRIAEDNPSSYDLGSMDNNLTSLDRTATAYRQVHDEICTTDADSLNQEEEQETADLFEESVDTTRSLIHRLMALRRAQRAATNFKSDLEDLEEADPHQDHSTSISQLTSSFKSLRLIIDDSTIHEDHPIHREVSSLKSRLRSLSAQEKKDPTPSLIASAPTPAKAKTVQLPKITLPSFNGDLMSWTSFWSQFKAAVDSNGDLTNLNKLAYLREAIKDPTTRALLFSGAEHEGMYSEVVTLLHERFDRRREVHANYCRELLNVGQVKSTKADLNNFADMMAKTISGLKHTGQYDLDSFLTSILVQSISKPLQIEWEVHSQEQKNVPPVEDFLKFIRFRASVLTTTPSSKAPEIKTEPSHPPKKYRAAIHASSSPAQHGFRYDCILCTDKHPLYLCPRFNSMTVAQRSDHLKANRLCYNCLAPGHKTADCRSLARCKTCTSKHHTMVHRDVGNQPPPSTTSPASTNTSVSSMPPAVPASLMMTSQVMLKGPSGRQLVVRALLDSGSTMSLISTRASQSLQLPQTQAHVTFSGIQDTPAQSTNMLVKFDICSLQPNQPTLTTSAAVVTKVTCDLPLQGATSIRDLPHIRDLVLADPTFHKPGRIDLLLGCDVLPKVLLPEAKPGPDDAPTAWSTIFGWTILGQFRPQGHSQPTITSSTNHTAVVETADSLLQRFWEIEETAPLSVTFTPEEEKVQHHFDINHVFLPTAGRYQVTLPRKQGLPPLGESRQQALQRYTANERSILRKNTWKSFQSVVQEYLDLGHAQLVPASALQEAPEHYYLPMHGVTKESSTTTKLRVVFDASAKASNGLSLNDTLLTGPTLYPNLDIILLRFRTYQIAVTADISKMYRAVELSPTNRDLHRFLWRATPDDLIRDYRMTRVTFGVSASPYLAVKALHQTSSDFGQDHPHASVHIKQSFYVDDLLAGADTPGAAIELHRELRSLLSKGGFDLRKWRSSSQEVLDSIDPSLLEQVPVKDLTDVHSATHPKALGVEWDAHDDAMSTSLTLPNGFLSTKRGVISDIAKTFDVLGWIAPSIILMKVLYQRLWELRLAWDEEIPATYLNQHVEWREQLHLLASKRLPRCYFAPQSNKITTQLHGFCDASQYAYGAVVYIRATYSDHDPTCTLVTAKTRVAPLKQLSIPRLELCGATLLAKLITNVRTALDIPLHDTHAWCDSTIVLAWLDGSSKRYRTFVGNRISTILQALPPAAWHHVPTLENPADCASRGLLPGELLDHSLWWNGPSWLSTEPIRMPVQPSLASLYTPELKAIVCHTATPVPPEWIEGRFESYHKLVCVTAWCFRFVSNINLQLQGHPKRSDPFLTASELTIAEHHLFSMAQKRSFQSELHQLQGDKPIKPTSHLLSLSPFVGKGGLLRVGGRLSNSHLSLSQQHPVILSSKALVIQLMFKYKHVALGHCGPTLLLSAVGTRLHVIGARRLARSTCKTCVTCRKIAARPEPQLMGQLPEHRITPSPPFSITGVDYAGPFTLKKGHTRRPVLIKAYLAIFVCCSTKAAHIEVVSDLTTEAFLACLRRFVARRGLPMELHSDNGSNFKGAKNDLTDLYNLLSTSSTTSAISAYLLSQRVQWYCIPERAPHFGGLWEAAVKSTKHHLRRVVGTQRLTYEELTTVATQIESCLNSRPLTALTSHTLDGLTALTPGHFLIGRDLQSYPETLITTQPSLLKRWNMCQSMVHHFWRRWSAEYLQQMQRLQKWKTRQPNLQQGDVVLIRDDVLFVNHWPLARVIETFPGKDGIVRVATVQTSTSTYKRPVTKLAIILSKEEQEQATPSTDSHHRESSDNRLIGGRMFGQEPTFH